MYLTSISNMGDVVGKRIDLILYKEEMTMAKIPRKEKEINSTQSHWSIYIGIDGLDRNNTFLIITNLSIS